MKRQVETHGRASLRSENADDYFIMPEKTKKRCLYFLLSAFLLLLFDSAGAIEPSKKTSPPDPPTIVKKIRYEIRKELVDSILIELNRAPLLNLFSLNEDTPKIVIDIQNVSTWKGPEIIPVNGHCIKRIRIHFHKDRKTLRVVLDLVDKAKEYIASPIFSETENIYSLEVKRNN